MSHSLGELAGLVGGHLEGDASIRIGGITSLDRAQPDDLSFVTSRRHVTAAERSRAAAFLAPPGITISGRPTIHIPQPYVAVALLLRVFHPEPEPLPGIHGTALIADSARVAPDATIHAFVVVGADSDVGARAVLHPYVFVGERCRIGEGAVLHPHVVLREDVRVGRRVVIHAGSVLGADGFGYAYDGTRHQKIPQVGHVVIEEDVEIGANVTVDRATMGETVIGRGTKIDNLVQIGHNTVVGSDAIIVAQTGIAGSCRIGNGVGLGGQVGITDHVQIGDGAQVGSQSGVHRDVRVGEQVFGSPAMPVAQARRAMVTLPRIPELIRTVRALERRLVELERRLSEGGP